MDSIYAIGFGLGLRFIVDLVCDEDIRLGGSLVGLWEGVVLHHFLRKMPKSFDPYIAYAVRLFIDFLFTESLSKLAIVVLWTGLGLVLSDVGPVFLSRTGLRRIIRRFRRELPYIELPSFSFPVSLFPRRRRHSRVRFHHASSPSSVTTTSTTRRSILSRPSPPQPPPRRYRSRPLRQFPGAFPDDWSDSDTDSVLPIPPPSNRASPVVQPFPEPSIPEEEEESDAEPEVEALPELPPIVLPEIPEEPLPPPVEAEVISPGHHTETPLEYEDLPTDLPEIQPSLINIPDIPTADLDGEEKFSSLMAPSVAATYDPPPPFEEFEGGGLIEGEDRVEGDEGIGRRGRYLLEDNAVSSRPDSSLSDLSTQTLLARAKMCRDAAIDEERKRDDYGSRWKEAQDHKRWKEAMLLKAEHEDAAKRVVRLHRKAEERFFRARNQPTDMENLDVRGLEPVEAQRRVEKRVRDLLTEDGTRLRVKVGGGGHPVHKSHIVKMTVLSLMKEYHIDAEVDRNDSTAIMISLPTS